jgi:hypothetical protein
MCDIRKVLQFQLYFIIFYAFLSLHTLERVGHTKPYLVHMLCGQVMLHVMFFRNLDTTETLFFNFLVNLVCALLYCRQ